MSLLLYSDQIPPLTDRLDRRLVELTGVEKPRLGYIPSGPDPGAKYYKERKKYYARYKITLEPPFDLGTGYDPRRLDGLLACDAIHLSGGNTFRFLTLLRERELLEPLRKYTRKGGLLVGVSAGAILLTPNVRAGLLSGDDPAELPADPTALALTPFEFVPHYGRFAALDEVEAFARRSRRVTYACPDGAGLAVSGDGTIQIIGGGVALLDPR